MNYLAHLHLGGSRPPQLLGSLYGDFVKGPLTGRWGNDIEQAIQVHRQIDAFTDSHPTLAHSRVRFPEARRRLAGVLLDVFFDHCLARDWQKFSSEPLEQFTCRVYGVLGRTSSLPEPLERIIPRMISQDWLGSYRDFHCLEGVLSSLSRRLSRPELFKGAWDELQQLYQPLSDDFQNFYPALQTFVSALPERQRSA